MEVPSVSYRAFEAFERLADVLNRSDQEAYLQGVVDNDREGRPASRDREAKSRRVECTDDSAS